MCVRGVGSTAEENGQLESTLVKAHTTCQVLMGVPLRLAERPLDILIYSV